MSKTAIILGATGLTGGELLHLLIESSDFNHIIYYGRTALDYKHEKLSQRIMNLFDIKDDAVNFYADVVFCCIGTTSAKTKDFDLYKRIDKGIPLDVADLCEENDIPQLIVMSSLGAHPKSAIEYSRIKGEMEQEVAERSINEIYFIEPSIIGGVRSEKRIAESIGKFAMTLIDPLMIGPLKKFRIIEPIEIAKAMIQISKFGHPDQQVENQHLLEFAKNYDFEHQTEE